MTVITRRAFAAAAIVVATALPASADDQLKLTIGGNFKARDGDERWAFDDCRSCNPYAPYTTYAGQDFNPGSAGVGGLEPLGRFRAGPIGAAKLIWKKGDYVRLVDAFGTVIDEVVVWPEEKPAEAKPAEARAPR